MVYTLIDHRNDAIKSGKLCSETIRLQLVVPVLNIFLCHFYGLKECRPGKIVVDLSKIIEVNSSLIKLGQCMCNQVKIGNNFIHIMSNFEPLGKGNH